MWIRFCFALSAIIILRSDAIELKLPPRANWNFRCQTHVIPVRQLILFGLSQKSKLNPTARSDQWNSCVAPRALEQKGITLNAQQKGGYPDEDQLIAEDG